MTLEPSPYVGYQKDRSAVRDLWERFNAGLIGETEGRTPYQRLLLEDWRRCTSLGVDVAMTHGRRLDPDEFRRRREAEQLLLDTSLPIIRDVGHFLVDVPGILILCERTGTVLHIDGDAAVKDRAASLSGIVEGSQWNEATAGTNGVGTALGRRQPVHVYATEHFCEGWHRWSCAAAPIFDVDGRTVLGIIDFTTVDTDFRDQALGLSVSLANTIQSRIALHRELERRRVLMQFGETARRFPHDDLIAFDHAGHALAHTPNERCRQWAEQWGRYGLPAGAPVRETIEVLAPGSAQRIGRIVVLGRPSGYQQVFREPPEAAATPAGAAAPDVRAGVRATARTGERPVDDPDVARFGDFVTRDPDTRRMLDDLERMAAAEVNLLIVGETGTGKELLARHVHALSRRRHEPYLAVNCGAISEQLMESTFFGYVKGAFSGADPRGRAGYFETAGGGTLFLDEIGELPLAMQAALLRVLEDGSFQRVGSCRLQRATCRVIAATHRDLGSLIAQGRFREDLYYRLKVGHRTIKPLRERPCDIDLLARQFAERLRIKHGLDAVTVSAASLELLRRYAWPGNAREMRNAIEAALLCADGVIEPRCLPPEIEQATRQAAAAAVRPAEAGGPSAPGHEAPPAAAAAATAPGAVAPTSPGAVPPTSPGAVAPEGLAAVRDYERQVIVGALRQHGNASRAAAALGIARSTLYRKFAELGIQPQEARFEASRAAG